MTTKKRTKKRSPGKKAAPKPPKDPVIRKIKSIQNRRTPLWLFRWASEQFGPFELDAAATIRDTATFNALCEYAYDEETNGLAVTSHWMPKTWVNPPFRYMKLWVFKAILEAQQRNVFTFMLAPIGGSQEWWHKLARQYTILYPDTRISYLDPYGRSTGGRDDEEPGADRDTCFLLIGPGFENPDYDLGRFRAYSISLKGVKRS